MPDVFIKMSELEKVKTSLDAIVEEFDNASSNSEGLESDIGDPFDMSTLRNKARDFEERWDIKRDELKESLEKVGKHLKDIIDGFGEWDTEAGLAFEPKKP